jgi:hypothetical protein
VVEKTSVITDRVEDLPSVERYLDNWKIIQRTRKREPYSYDTRWCGENDGRMQALHGPQPYQYRLAHRKPLRYFPVTSAIGLYNPSKAPSSPFSVILKPTLSMTLLRISSSSFNVAKLRNSSYYEDLQQRHYQGNRSQYLGQR